jgi:glycosyltransferase involved in cell wall biosynthesis
MSSAPDDEGTRRETRPWDKPDGATLRAEAAERGVTAMRVSLCMIVRNEEMNLEACLGSAAGLTEELVVVDTGSTDRTKEIARAYGARVFDFPWCDDFSAARNASIGHATGDWIFWLDADDRLDLAGRVGLRTLFASLPDTRDGYLVRCVSSGASGLEAMEGDHVRVFRNDPRLRFFYRVHEQVAPSILRARGTLRTTDVVIHHEGYRDRSTYRRKQERNLALLELACRERPLDSFMLYYRGVAMLDLDRHAEAIVSLSLASGLVPRATAVARLLPLHLAEAYQHEGMHREAAEVLRVAGEQYPTDPGIAYGEAVLLYKHGEFERAEQLLSRHFAVAGGAPRPDNFVGDASIQVFLSRHLRASLYFLLERHEDAERDARLVVAARPEFGEGWLLLCDALGAQGKSEEAERTRSTLETEAGGDILSTLLLASRAALAGDRDAGLRIVEERIRSGGKHIFLERAQQRLPNRRARCAAHLLSASVLPPLMAPLTSAGGRAIESTQVPAR